MSEVNFVGGVMTDTVTALESISKVIDVELFYCVNLWSREIKLQGHYKSEVVKTIRRRLKTSEIDVHWEMNSDGFAVCEFMYNERKVKITLT
jgi:hypothetical protein